MTWNLRQLPDVGAEQRARLEPTIGFIARYADLYALDVVVLTEVFDEDAFAAIRARLAGRGMRFSFASQRPEGILGGLNDGGVCVLARGSARLSFLEVYDASTSWDGFAAKGAVGVEVDKAGRRFLVCGTHLQASYETAPDASGRDPEAEFRVVRARQSAELATWIAARRGDRRVIIAGDLNIDAGDAATVQDRTEWTSFLARHQVRAAAAWYPKTTLRHTYDPAANTLARMTCEGDLRKRLLDHVVLTGPVDGTFRWIAYPQTPSAWKPPEWVSLTTADGHGNTSQTLSNVIFHDLSDHFPTFLEVRL
jgi:endonuclease/exonuclease/phosphatase family metal-dependent hydrolase